MISKLLFNINNLFYYLLLALIVTVLLYLIYKFFILENDVYILNEKIYKLECNGGQCPISKNKISNEEMNMNEIIMSQIFNNDDDENEEETIINKDIDIINIEDLLPEKEMTSEAIFDLKKETVMDDKESIISSNNLTKKKLSKLNLDKLKEKCIELELNTEGTKAQLIDRIFEKEMS